MILEEKSNFLQHAGVRRKSALRLGHLLENESIASAVQPSRETMIDRIDRRILSILQEDCTIPVAEVGRRVGLSTTPCWRRIQKLEEDGVIQRRVAILDPRKVNVKVTAFVSITTSQHNDDWLRKFADVISEFPEVVEFYRMAGQVDYLLRVAVPDIEAYDAFYKRLIARIEISDVSTSFAMEQIKSTSELPLAYVPTEKSRNDREA
jgi:Lrp/AsnC family transcriptional regulator